MLNTKESNINFLDSLFTQKDFYFLNSSEEEIKLIQNQIDKEQEIREFIVETINSFENNLKNLNKDNISPFADLLDELNKSFVLVNFNIKSLLSLKEDLKNINSSIINLLVAIESNPNNKQSHIEQANSLSQCISNYSNSCTSIKSQISDNDLFIKGFLNSNKFKNIFNTPHSSNSTSSVYNTFDVNISTDKKIEDVVDSSDDTNNIYNSNVLRVSEKENKVYLPYKNSEIKSYLVQFPKDYSSAEDVIEKEFIFPLERYIKHPVLSRFRETYSLVRDREAKPVMEAIKHSMDLMFTYELNPTIIAACKTQEQLENYLNCLENNELDNFKDFEIKFEISPI